MESRVLTEMKNASSLTARTLSILGSPLILLALEQHTHKDNRDALIHTFTSTIPAIHNASRFKIDPRKRYSSGYRSMPRPSLSGEGTPSLYSLDVNEGELKYTATVHLKAHASNLG